MTEYKIVNGERVALTEDELAEYAARNAAWVAGEAKREALKAIAALEASVTPRMLQEAAIGSAETGLGPDGSLTAKQFIAALREQVGEIAVTAGIAERKKA